MKSGTVINYFMVGLLTFALGFYMGGTGCSKQEETKPQPTAQTGEDRYNIPLEDSYYKGIENAPITIVEFSEFQCPFCSRVTPTVKQIMDSYENQVKIVFKHNPLPFHKDAPLASEAALAAGEQGKFWEMHDKLFANQQQLDRPSLERYAEELGLDMGKFKAALDEGKFKAKVERDKAQAEQFGARGTPHFFINGIRLSGAQPFDKFKAVIDTELPKAMELQKSGVPSIYAEVVKNAKTKADAPKARQQEDDKSIYKVATGTNMKGDDSNALVTIVEFSDYQCPFCSRAEATVNQVMEEYKGKIRLFFRHNPLPFHKDALPAAKAAEAAAKQGKFWEMHKKLFENQKSLDEASLQKYAQEIGLNLDRFKQDFADTANEEKIKADQAEAAKFGARGTPAFFINGRKFVGAQPIENFKKLLDELIPIAEKAGKKGEALYAELTKDGKDKADAPAAQPQQQAQEDPNKVYTVPAGSSAWKGAKNAPVEIVEFSEFQCPFCSRVTPTIKQILQEYGNKVKVVFKHNPLPFHKDAQLASEAALAAGEQGKFWEMHDKLFENQKALDRASLEKYAQEIGLNVAKFTKALDSGAFKGAIEDDKKLASEVGVRGTPAFFINGKKLVGAQPFEAFKTKIDEALGAKK